MAEQVLFRKASEEQESRLLTLIGMAVVACLCAVSATLILNPFGGRPVGVINVIIESPFAGQGVDPGTPLMMHGVKVGEITQVTNLVDGGVRLITDLESEPAAGLTDTLGVDFRPANYFGVTGINLRPGQGGHVLTDGALIKVTPTGDFTLQALLQRLGALSDGVITEELIDVIERTTTYLDGLDPLLETMLVVADSVTRVQSVSTAQLMTNAAGISVAFPGFVDAAIKGGDSYLHGALDGAAEDYYQNTFKPTIDLAANSLFGAAGTLVGSHSTDLEPMTNMIKVLTDIVPGLIPSEAIAASAREYRERLQRLFAGAPNRRAVNVRVILDSLPGIAAPIDALGAAPEIITGDTPEDVLQPSAPLPATGAAP